MDITKQTQCIKCKKITRVHLVRNITASGTSQVYWRCEVCKQNAGGSAKWLPHEPIETYGVDIDTIEVIKDDRTETCEVCGTLGAEFHHWLPQYLWDKFGEGAHKWPGGYLCHSCHERWHRTVTPGFAK
jgi:hypothetical protein